MISIGDVKQIAKLARIELTLEEEQKYEKELSAILDFVEKLNEVNTDHVEPMTGGTIEKNAMRNDEQIDAALEGKAEALIKATPETKDGYVKVKAVFN
jgi:aspartyl-tRNA(Asn)/glutamyl-tRNA(Gln) amidotransferase subunit C